MNKWECGHPDCPSTCVGVQGAVGLRAIGWYVERGPYIFCPAHRPDAAIGNDCAVCVAEVWAFHYQQQIDPTMSHVPILAIGHASGHRP